MIRIVLGLVALGIVVFIHELGHFIAARLSGVTVESFSLGWGPPLLKFKRGDTEYRLSAFPMGGYCGMKGQDAYREALDANLSEIPREKGSFYGAHPLKRIAISFAGPFSNLLFSVLVFAFVSAVGYTYQTWENRIIPVPESIAGYETAAIKAGLLPGDRLISMDGIPIAHFADLQKTTSQRAGKTVLVNYERDGVQYSTTVVIEMDKKTGAGKIGVLPWIPLIISTVKDGSAASSAGVRPGDRIIAIDGTAVSHYFELTDALSSKPEQAIFTIQRNDIEIRIPIVLLYKPDTGTVETGMDFERQTITIAGTGLIQSMEQGIQETARTLYLTVKSLGLLFKGVDMSEAVSGPVRITLMLGEVAQSSLIAVAELLAIICVSLFIMNLLPIPILDGGIIFFSLIELIRRKQLRPKTLYRFQFVGIAFIVFLFIFALFGDISYLIK